MLDVTESLERAARALNSGRLLEAENLMSQIAAQVPFRAEVWHVLGVIALQKGQLDQAVNQLQRSTQLDSSKAAAHFHLGQAYWRKGLLEQAIESYRSAISIEPLLADAHARMGNALQRQGRYDEAIVSYRKALAITPKFVEVLGNLGTVLHGRGEYDEAIVCYQKVLSIQPDSDIALQLLGRAYLSRRHYSAASLTYRKLAEIDPRSAVFLCSLGDALRFQGEYNEAISCYKRALGFEPGSIDAHHGLATSLLEQGKLDEAESFFRQVVELAPSSAEALYNLGNVLQKQGRLYEAAERYRLAISLVPTIADAYHNLGNVLLNLGELDEAIACYHRAIDIQPTFAEAHINLGNLLHRRGNAQAADECYRKALDLQPSNAVALSNYLASLQYREGVSVASLAVAHAEFERLFASPLKSSWQPHDNSRDPDRILRLGFVSPDFAQHPIGLSLLRVFPELDRSKCRIYCYSSRFIKDIVTEQLEQAVDEWRDVPALSDDALASLVRTDKIDILIDLSGHTADNRLLAFARKPAPIQASWMGYVGPTGVEAIDYVIADKWLVSDEHLNKHQSKFIRLPRISCCYDVPVSAPLVHSLPALKSGFVTFASFNNPAKVTPLVAHTWSRILRTVSNSRLIIKYRGLDSSSAKDSVRKLLSDAGISRSRLEIQGWSPFEEMLSMYNSSVDLALDPFPYNGGTTTMISLYMGVPVVSFPGETAAARQSYSVLMSLGLVDCIAKDVNSYVELAADLVNDLPRLSAMRAGLRSRYLSSPLCDPKSLASELLSALRSKWYDWCKNELPVQK